MHEHILDWTGVHDAASVHDDHPIRCLAGNGEVMRDEQRRELVILLHVQKKLQNLVLDSNVERRDDLNTTLSWQTLNLCYTAICGEPAHAG